MPVIGGNPVDAGDLGPPEFRRRPVEDELAASEADDPVGVAAGEFELMQADDRRDAVGLADAVQEREHAVGGRRIEAGDRLVGEHDRRLLHQRAGNADALLLAAGQIVGAPQRVVDKADPLDGGEREPPFGGREREQGAQAGMVAEPPGEHVGEHAQAADQLVLLEHHAGAAPMRAHAAAVVQVADIWRGKSWRETRPAVGVTRPLSARSNVDLPAPEGPSSTVKAPISKLSVAGASARIPPA